MSRVGAWLRRWRDAAHAELARVGGLVRVLMKPRNGEPWTADDRIFLRRELRRLGRAVPAFLILLLPGTFVLLPLYAWFLDRRRVARSRVATASPPAVPD